MNQDKNEHNQYDSRVTDRQHANHQQDNWRWNFQTFDTHDFNGFNHHYSGAVVFLNFHVDKYTWRVVNHDESWNTTVGEIDYLSDGNFYDAHLAFSNWTDKKNCSTLVYSFHDLDFLSTNFHNLEKYHALYANKSWHNFVHENTIVVGTEDRYKNNSYDRPLYWQETKDLITFTHSCNSFSCLRKHNLDYKALTLDIDNFGMEWVQKVDCTSELNAENTVNTFHLVRIHFVRSS